MENNDAEFFKLYFSSVLGTHLNMVAGNSPSISLTWFLAAYLPSGWVLEGKEEEEMVLPFSDLFSNLLLETGYMHIQATKPDTVGTSII